MKEFRKGNEGMKRDSEEQQTFPEIKKRLRAFHGDEKHTTPTQTHTHTPAASHPSHRRLDQH